MVNKKLKEKTERILEILECGDKITLRLANYGYPQRILLLEKYGRTPRIYLTIVESYAKIVDWELTDEIRKEIFL